MIFVHTLGQSAILAGNKELTPRSSHSFALLFYLCVERGRYVSRPILCDLLFPERPITSAKHSVRQLAYELRRLGVPLKRRGDDLCLPGDAAALDVDEILRGELPAPAALAAAAAGLMPDFTPEHSESYREWYERFKADCVRRAVPRLLTLSAHLRAARDWDGAVLTARAAIGLDPANETAATALAGLDGSISIYDGGAALPHRVGEIGRERPTATATTPFLGRGNELRVFRYYLDAAAGGGPRWLTIYGEPGIGKTRLAEECCCIAKSRRWRVARLSAVRRDLERPMGACIDLVAALREMPGGLGISEPSRVALDRLSGRLEFQTASDETRIAAAEVHRAHIIQAIGDLADAVASERPLVLFIDDLQWIDHTSRTVLSDLAAAVPERPLLILATSRTIDAAVAFTPTSTELCGTGECLELSALTPDACAQLVNSLADEYSLALTAELKRWLVRTAGGNPLFLRSLVAHYAETDQPFRVPPTLAELLDRRLADLPPAAQTVLATCAQLGAYATAARVRDVLDLSHRDLVMVLAILERARVLTDDAGVLRPSHPLLEEAAKRLLPAGAAKLNHEHMAELLERDASADGGNPLLWACAEHWLAAGQIERGATRLRECADRAMEMGRPREAAELLIDGARILPDPGRSEFALRGIQVAGACGELELIPQAAELVCEEFLQLSGLSLMIEIASARALLFGDPDSAQFLMDTAADGNLDEHTRLTAARHAMIVAAERADAESAQLLANTVSRFAAIRDSDRSVAATTILLIYHTSFGDVSRATQLAEELANLSVRLPAHSSATTYRHAAAALWKAGEASRARDLLELAFRNARRAGLHRIEYACALMIGQLSGETGLPGDADHWLAIAESALTRLPTRKSNHTHLYVKAARALNAGDAAALEESRAALQQLYDQSGDKRWRRLADAAAAALHLFGNGSALSSDMPESLIRHHKRGGEPSDIADFEAAVAARLYISAGNKAAARSTIRRYLGEYRRDRAALAPLLQATIDDLRLRVRP